MNTRVEEENRFNEKPDSGAEIYPARPYKNKQESFLEEANLKLTERNSRLEKLDDPIW